MFNIEAYIQKLLALRLGRIQGKHHTIGTGSGQPMGAVTGSTLGKTGATGQTTSVTYDDLVDLEHSVDPIYRASARWMMHDDTLKVLRKIKDSQNRPIFVPGYETGNPGGAPIACWAARSRSISTCPPWPLMQSRSCSVTSAST